MRSCENHCGHPACFQVCQSLSPTSCPPAKIFKPGTYIYRPYGTVRYRVLSPPFLRTYWDLRGNTAKQRNFWLIVLLYFVVQRMPLTYIFGIPLIATSHKENNWMLQDGSVLLFFPYTYRVRKEVLLNDRWKAIATNKITPRWY